MKNKKLLIIALVFVLVLVVAGALYSRLGENMTAGGLVTAPTEAPTEATAADPQVESTEATTQDTQPEVVPALDFTAVDGDGNEVKLSDYFGKPIVLNFWAHWCGPCQSEMPEFNAMYEELGGEVTFLMTHVGAAVDDGKEAVAQGGYTFPVIFDTASQAAAIYGVNAFPTTFFIDSDGNLQAYYVGSMTGELLQTGVDLIHQPQQ